MSASPIPLTSLDPARLQLPEKPALEGLEAKWMPRWEESGVYRFDRDAAARRGLLDRHAAADRQRLAARRPRVLVHPHRPRSRGSSGCAARRCSIRWAGTTTACRPSAACRTTTACAAIRRCPTIRRSRRRTNAGQAADLGVASELHRAVHPPDGRGREGVRASLEVARPVGGLVDDLRDHRPARAARVAARVPAPAAARAGLSGRSADAVGRRLQDRGRAGGARGPRAAGRLSPHPVRASPESSPASRRRDRNDPPRADPRLRRARRAPRR